MKKFVGFSLIFSGVIFAAFLANLLLYCFVPSYRNALERRIGKDDDIPVIVIEKTQNASETEALSQEEDNISEIPVPLAATYIGTEDSVIEDGEEESFDEKPQIVDKDYYEDCGTGRAYWVIRYSDGTTEIENVSLH